MTRSDTLLLFGDTVPVRYMDTSGVYHSVSASAVGSPAYLQIANQWQDSTGYMISNREFILYQFETEGTLNTQPRSITVDISCQYSIFDTEYIYTAAAMPCGNTTNISAYNSPTWSWYWAGDEVQFSPSDLAQNNVLPQVYFADWCDFVPAYMESQALTSGYSLRLTFDHAVLASGRYCYFYIGLPYVSQGASGNIGTSGLQTGTTAAETTSGTSVDLGETNGILGGISSAISNLFNKVTNIFNILDDSSIIDDTSAIDSVPDRLDYDTVLDDAEQIMIDADQMLEDVPEITEAWAVTWSLVGSLFTGRAVIFVVLIPFACLLSMLSYMLWRG